MRNRALPILVAVALLVAASSVVLAQDPPPGAQQRSVQVTGVLTDEGVECRALRGDDGQLYTLTGDLGDFQTGDRVRVVGKVAERTFCGQGTTLEVQNIKAAKE